MRSLLLFECKKLLHQRYLLFFTVLLLFVNGCNIYLHYDLLLTPEKTLLGEDVSKIDIIRLRMDRDVHGIINSEKLQKLQQHYRDTSAMVNGEIREQVELYFPIPYTDMVITKEILDEMERLYTYEQAIVQPLQEKNTALKEQAQMVGDLYGMRSAKRVEFSYSGRNISAYERVNEFEPLLSYHLSALFLLLLCVYCASNLFAGEKETQMEDMIRCTPKGARLIFWIKLLMFAMLCLTLGLLFFSQDLFMFWLCRRPSGFLLPIYALKDWAYTPLNCSILSFFILLSFLKVLAAWLIGILVLLFSVLFQKAYQAFVAGFLAVVALMTLSLFTDGVFHVVRWFNPMSLFIADRLFETLRLENVIGYPFPLSSLAVAGSTLFGGILLFAAQRLYQRRQGAC